MAKKDEHWMRRRRGDSEAERSEVTIHNKYVEPHNARGTRQAGEQKRARGKKKKNKEERPE